MRPVVTLLTVSLRKFVSDEASIVYLFRCSPSEDVETSSVVRIARRSNPPELHQSLVCQGLLPPISCGGGVSGTISNKVTSLQIVNLR